MDAELYTFWDMVVFYLLYYRVFLFGVLFLLDIHLFTRWKRGRAAIWLCASTPWRLRFMPCTCRLPGQSVNASLRLRRGSFWISMRNFGVLNEKKQPQQPEKSDFPSPPRCRRI